MTPRRVLVVGCNGLLGQRVTEMLLRGAMQKVTIAARTEKPVVPFANVSYLQLDITKKRDVKRVVAECEPDVIINAAAMTSVDECEKERELAWKVNVGGVENIVEAARRTEATVLHVSTDYIFDGKGGPYTERDRPQPLNYYGKSKLASENQLRVSGLKHLIARTIVLYGFAPSVKSNFALWLIQNLEQNLPVRVVDDQWGNPTLVDDLAHALVSALELGRTGIYNIGGREVVSRYEFALKLAAVFGFDKDLITPIKTAQLHQPAARPLRSGLVTLKAEVELGFRPSTVEEGLAVLKGQMSRNPRRLPDSAPVPSTSSRRR